MAGSIRMSPYGAVVELRLPRGAGTRDHGYAVELDADLDGASQVILDAGDLVGLHPLFTVRFALWMERQQQAGRSVEIKKPEDGETLRCFRACRLGKDIGGVAEALVEADPDVIIRPTRLSELTEVDGLADRLLQPLIDHFDDVAVVRDAALMAISELCQNAVEHGTSDAGCVVAASRGEVDGLSRIMLGIGDHGIGIPEHIRRSHPEFVVDKHAIGQALEAGVSGTQRPDRGYGFSWVLKETLSSAASSAEMFIRAGKGTFRREIVDIHVKDHGWKTALTQGTWIACDWTTIGRSAS
jgi:anti-sigma regulatory factor (Ser/Thr protein kinase)